MAVSIRWRTTVVGFRRRTLVLGSEHQMENNSSGPKTEIDSS